MLHSILPRKPLHFELGKYKIKFSEDPTLNTPLDWYQDILQAKPPRATRPIQVG